MPFDRPFLCALDVDSNYRPSSLFAIEIEDRWAPPPSPAISSGDLSGGRGTRSGGS